MSPRVHLRGLGQDDGGGIIDILAPVETGPVVTPQEGGPSYIYPSAPAYTPPAPVDTSIYDIEYGGAAPSGETAAQYEAAAAGSPVSPAPGGNLVSAITSAAAGMVSRPSPVLSVPLSTQIPGSVGMFLSGSTLIAGIPNVMIFAGLGLGVLLLMGGGKRRRR